MPGCREVVRHNENGLFVPVKNFMASANSIERLLSDPDLRERMGKKGREIVMAEFAVEKVVAQTMALYEDLRNEK